jgi:5-oxoprolinase (ATP-hydrolysing) subunit A
MAEIDLNSDVGESFGAWSMGADDAVLAHVTSANIACGLHAGDPATIARTVAICKRFNVAVGAHPGFPDLAGFGRRAMALAPDEVFGTVLYQVGAVQAFARAAGLPLHHVKAHGALYNMAARDAAMAEAICRAVRAIDPKLPVYGLAGSAFVAAAATVGVPLVQEVFADRTYQDDGSLTPRTRPDAMITDAQRAIDQVIGMVTRGEVVSVSGKRVKVVAQTLCIHGDQPGAADFAQRIRAKLQAQGVQVRAS